MKDMTTLEVVGISKTFQTADGQLEILNSVDLDLSAGESLAITGPSGSGKSTLLYIIGLLETPSAGSVRIMGSEPLLMDAAAQAEFRNQRIGFVFQDHHLLPQCTVLENVLLPLLALDRLSREDADSDAAEQRALDLLKRVGLEHRIHHFPAQISGGEKQRAAVCRALIRQPSVLLADEPTGNLDPTTAEAVGDLLLEMSDENQTALICVTHSQSLAERFSECQALESGKLVTASRS